VLKSKVKTSAKFVGHPSQDFVAGLPARDISEDEFDRMSEEEQARLAEFPQLYELSTAASKVAEVAAEHVAEATPEPVVIVSTPAIAPEDAPKGRGRS
jgi:hypothetical protein